jgi:hypothetical protein
MEGDTEAACEAPPPAQPQVIVIVQSAGSLKDDYATKATIPGSLQLLCGLATLVMAIISAISAGIFLISSYYYLGLRGHYTMIVTGLLMLVVGMTTGALTCRPLCRRRATTGATPGLPASQVLGQEDPPPSYSDVTGSNSKYQKF